MLLSEAQEVMLPLCQFVGQIVNMCNFREAIQAERVKRCVRRHYASIDNTFGNELGNF